MAQCGTRKSEEFSLNSKIGSSIFDRGLLSKIHNTKFLVPPKGQWAVRKTCISFDYFFDVVPTRILSDHVTCYFQLEPDEKNKWDGSFYTENYRYTNLTREWENDKTKLTEKTSMRISIYLQSEFTEGVPDYLYNYKITKTLLLRSIVDKYLFTRDLFTVLFEMW